MGRKQPFESFLKNVCAEQLVFQGSIRFYQFEFYLHYIFIVILLTVDLFSIKKVVASFDKKLLAHWKKRTDNPREESISEEAFEEPITVDSKRTLSLRTIKRTLSMRNLKKIQSLKNLKRTLSLRTLKRTLSLRSSDTQ